MLLPKLILGATGGLVALAVIAALLGVSAVFWGWLLMIVLGAVHVAYWGFPLCFLVGIPIAMVLG